MTKSIRKASGILEQHLAQRETIDVPHEKLYIVRVNQPRGRVREWLNRPVSKTGIPPSGIEGSNPSPSAKRKPEREPGFFVFHPTMN